LELRHDGETVKLKALVDTGASKSVVSKKLADELKAFTPLKEAWNNMGQALNELGRQKKL